MKIKKLIIAIAGLIPLASSADEVFMDAQWSYRIIDNINNKVQIIGTTTAERPETLVIPSQASYANKTYTVTGIGK